MTNIVNGSIIKEYRNGKNKIIGGRKMQNSALAKTICFFPGVNPNGTAEIGEKKIDFVICNGRAKTSCQLTSRQKMAFEEALRLNGMPIKAY